MSFVAFALSQPGHGAARVQSFGVPGIGLFAPPPGDQL
jgi:hypothetical protein